MKKLLFFVLAVLIHCTAYSAEGFSTLEERMSGKEFKETGLSKLTDAELSALNNWLRRHSVATLENPTAQSGSHATSTEATTDMRGFENQPTEENPDKVINSSIVGTFDGWDGKGTLFQLANGMVWQQTENDSFYIKPTQNPEITIRKGFMGNWRLSVVGHNSAVRVKRIK